MSCRENGSRLYFQLFNRSEVANEGLLAGRMARFQLNWLSKLLVLKEETRGAFLELKQQVEQPLGPIFLNTVFFFFLLIFNLMSIRRKIYLIGSFSQKLLSFHLAKGCVSTSHARTPLLTLSTQKTTAVVPGALSDFLST